MKEEIGMNALTGRSPLMSSEKTDELKDPGKPDENDPALLEKQPSIDKYDLPPFTEKKILKNVFVVSLGFVFMFTAFMAIGNLQTSLNREEGVGSISIALIYAFLVLSSMFLPKVIISRLGCKWTISISMLTYILYMAANFYAVKGTMFVTAIILGMGAAPLWSAKCTYLTQVAVWYAKLTDQDRGAIINRFFGVFFCFFQTSKIWGNLIASEVFTSPKTQNESVPENVCGSQFCGNGTSNFDQDKEKVYTLCAIFLASGVMAVIVVSIFLDPIKLDQESSEEDRTLNRRLVMSTFKHLINSPIQMMLIPISVYAGVQRAFLSADYTQAYISCSLGIWNLGYVLICFGVVNAVCSFLFGILVKYTGHIILVCLAFVIFGGLNIALLLWTPRGDQEIIFYIVSGIWGIGDAILNTMLNALYGEVFMDNAEAGFANYKLWESAGWAIPFAYNDILCTDTKLYVWMGVLCAAVVGYGAAEVVINMKRRRSLTNHSNKEEVGSPSS